MGVFARILRRSKGTETTEVTETGSEPAETQAETETAETEATPSGTAEVVGIPKQQSAEQAADSEAGESART
ncbi:hypothetical protein OK074_2258 [Actinobacteria bacterium OK074]|nr:hypothetical protein OK074_2258 [Actinobacteria bacterium OK074]